MTFFAPHFERSDLASFSFFLILAANVSFRGLRSARPRYYEDATHAISSFYHSRDQHDDFERPVVPYSVARARHPALSAPRRWRRTGCATHSVAVLRRLRGDVPKAMSAPCGMTTTRACSCLRPRTSCTRSCPRTYTSSSSTCARLRTSGDSASRKRARFRSPTSTCWPRTATGGGLPFATWSQPPLPPAHWPRRSRAERARRRRLERASSFTIPRVTPWTLSGPPPSSQTASRSSASCLRF